MGFANPVPGRIQAREEQWAGAPTFIVTSTFAEHVASGRGPGIDIGNSQQGAPVFAMEAGVVSLAGLLGTAKVVRVKHPQLGSSNETGYAHLATIAVGVGQAVARGQQIGTVGMTGANAPHLHGGYKINGVEVDWWPMLDQNMAGAGGTEVVLGNNPERLVAKKSSTKVEGAKFRAAPAIDPTPVLTQYPVGTVFYPDFKVGGQAVGGSTDWYTGALWTGNHNERGYFHASVLTPLVDMGGDCADEVAKAKAVGKAEGEAAAEAKWEQWVATHP